LKKLSIVAFCVVAALAANSCAYAVNDLLAPKSEDGKKQWTHFFTPSLRTRVQYDDNCTSSNPKFKSWESMVGPKMAFKLPYEKSYIGADWEYTNIGYAQRPGDKFDNNHDVNMTLRQDLSDRVTVGVKQFFQYKQQPYVYRQPIDDLQGNRSTSSEYAWMYAFTSPNLQENADYGLYDATIGVDYRMNRKVSFDFTYNFERLDFMQSSGIVGDSLTYNMHTFMTVLNYRLLPEALFLMDMRFVQGDYDDIGKDYQAFIIAPGIKNRLGKSVIINGRAGYEYRKPNTKGPRLAIPGQTVAGDTEHGKNESHEPFVEADMTYLFSRATQAKIGYKLKVQNTEQPAYSDTKVQGVYGALTHKLTAKTYLMFFASQESRYYYDYRELEANLCGAAGPFEPHETITKCGFMVTQQLKPWMFLELGYRYIDVHSDFSPLGWNTGFGDMNFASDKGTAMNASYTRNRIFSGINIVF